MTDLHELLERSTDAIEPPGLAVGALADARRRRTRLRGAGAALVAAAAVLVLIVSVRVATGDPRSEEPPADPATTPTRTPSESTVVVQPRWDPRAVDELPPAPDEVAALLPDVLEVPTSTPALADDPVEAAVLTLGRGDAVKLLGVDGAWRHVPLPAPYGSVVLTRDGRKLAVGTETGVDVWELAAGTRTSLPLPAGFRRSDSVRWDWLDDRTLLLDGLWQVDARTGDARRVGGPQEQFVVDDVGGIYEYGWDSSLNLLQVRGDTVAGVGWSDLTDSSAVAVTDRDDGRSRAVLPVLDPDASYANGGLSVQALLDDGTVLLRVLVQGRDQATLRFVAWDPGSGDLVLVTRTLDVLPSWSWAVDLL